jgi:hypothetical protein
MAPLIRDGDLVITVPATELRTGDIVIVSGSHPAVHRVVKVLKGDVVLTKGDVSLSLDRPMTRDNLAGKVTIIVRKESKPILMEGWLWRVGNYLMARYSLACFLVWESVSKNKWLLQTCRRFSAPLKYVYMSAAKVMSGLANIQRGRVHE